MVCLESACEEMGFDVCCMKQVHFNDGILKVHSGAVFQQCIVMMHRDDACGLCMLRVSLSDAFGWCPSMLHLWYDSMVHLDAVL